MPQLYTGLFLLWCDLVSASPQTRAARAFRDFYQK